MEKTDKRWKRRTNDGKDGQTMEKTDKRWKRRTNDGKDGQTMEKTDKRWKRRTNDGKDGQTMEKTDKRWKRRTNDGKDGQTMEKTDKRWKRRTRFLIHLSSNFGQISVGVIFTAINLIKRRPNMHLAKFKIFYIYLTESTTALDEKALYFVFRHT